MMRFLIYGSLLALGVVMGKVFYFLAEKLIRLSGNSTKELRLELFMEILLVIRMDAITALFDWSVDKLNNLDPALWLLYLLCLLSDLKINRCLSLRRLCVFPLLLLTSLIEVVVIVGNKVLKAVSLRNSHLSSRLHR